MMAIFKGKNSNNRNDNGTKTLLARRLTKKILFILEGILL